MHSSAGTLPALVQDLVEHALLFHCSVCLGEIATGGGGVSGSGGDPQFPLPYVSIAASQPLPGTGTPTGWRVTFRNGDSTSHTLPFKVYVNCITPGS